MVFGVKDQFSWKLERAMSSVARDLQRRPQNEDGIKH